MNRNRITLVLLAVFVLVLGGAYLLYRTLAGDAGAQLMTESSTSAQATAQPGQTAESGQTTESGQTAESQATEPPQVEAPDFTVYDSDGNPVQFSDFEGKPVVLNFWASWCGPCQSEMPDFQQAFDQYGEEIHFVMVNSTDGSQETVDTASDYLEEQGFTFPVYFDTDGDASITYGVTGLPTTFFVDSDGYLVAYASGALSADLLQQGIDMILPDQ